MQANIIPENIVFNNCYIVPELSDKDEYRLQLQSDFDMAEEYLKEEERLQQKALKYRRMALERQKKAILASLDYG